jgi:SAM-dependent methyltransferase
VSALLEYLKRVYLNLSVGYLNPQKYFDKRWSLGLPVDQWSRPLLEQYYRNLGLLMDVKQCENFLDIGCGLAVLRNLRNYLGVDFSIESLKRSGLNKFVFADVSDGIPFLASKSFDMVFTRYVLLHIPPDRIGGAVREISRLAKKCVVLDEPVFQEGIRLKKHNFNHDLQELFKDFDGELIFLQSNSIA